MASTNEATAAEASRPVTYITWNEPRDTSWFTAMLGLTALAVALLAMAL